MVKLCFKDTASGVMGAFFAKYIKNNNIEESLNLIIEQGHEIKKDGRVMVQVLIRTKITNLMNVGGFCSLWLKVA
jgi:predicted PhzF superfamily epimerase YddE/YHI9